MNTDQFDDLVAGHLRATAPREAPARVLDAALDRIADTPQRRTGWRRPGRAGGLLAAAAVVILAVVAGTQLSGLMEDPVGTDPSMSPSVAPSESAVPSPSAEPSATPPLPVPTEPAISRDAPLLRVVTLGGPTDPVSLLPGFVVTEDGTAIWRPVSTTEFAGYLTRKLTADGLAELRDVLFGDGLLDADATYQLEPLPGAEPPGRGGFEHTFTVGDGADRVVVTSVGWLGDEEEAAYYEPSPERQALDDLANRLRDAEALLGEDAWDGPAAAYEAEDYLLVIRAYRDVPPFGNPDVSQVPLAIDRALDEFGEPYGDIEPPTARCAVISSDEAADVVEALTTLGVAEENSVGMDRATVASLDWAEGSGTADLSLLPRMPGEYPACDARP